MTNKKKTVKKYSPPKYYNKYTHHLQNSQGLVTTLPSLTIPGEALSASEIIRKSARGELPPMAKGAFHGYDVDIDSIDAERSTDLTDMDEAKQIFQEMEEEKEALEIEQLEIEKQEKEERENELNEKATDEILE